MTRTSSSSSTSGGSSSSSSSSRGGGGSSSSSSRSRSRSSSSSRCGCQCMSATGAGGAAGVGTDVVLAAVGPHISGFECTLAGKPGFERVSRESRRAVVYSIIRAKKTSLKNRPNYLPSALSKVNKRKLQRKKSVDST